MLVKHEVIFVGGLRNPPAWLRNFRARRLAIPLWSAPAARQEEIPLHAVRWHSTTAFSQQNVDAHRGSLHKAQARKGPWQAGGLEKTARNRIATKLPETRALTGPTWRSEGAPWLKNIAGLSPELTSIETLRCYLPKFAHESILNGTGGEPSAYVACH